MEQPLDAVNACGQAKSEPLPLAVTEGDGERERNDV